MCAACGLRIQRHSTPDSVRALARRRCLQSRMHVARTPYGVHNGTRTAQPSRECCGTPPHAPAHKQWCARACAQRDIVRRALRTARHAVAECAQQKARCGGRCDAWQIPIELRPREVETTRRISRRTQTQHTSLAHWRGTRPRCKPRLESSCPSVHAYARRLSFSPVDASRRPLSPRVRRCASCYAAEVQGC